MSSKGKLLRKLRKIMGAAITLPSLVACSSQISCGEWYCYSKNGVSYTYDSDLKTLLVSGKGKVADNFHYGTEINSKEVRKIVIYDGITEIASYAFVNFEGPEIVIIPSTVKTIGECAFSGCERLKNIDIPEGVTKIGRRAFSTCWNLKHVTIPSSVKTIGDEVFSCCTSL